VKALQTTRERATKHALHRVDCSLCKARAKSWLEKAADIIFFSEAFESFMAALIVVGGLYFLAHLAIAIFRGWL
jgi:hypothetical protein